MCIATATASGEFQPARGRGSTTIRHCGLRWRSSFFWTLLGSHSAAAPRPRVDSCQRSTCSISYGLSSCILLCASFCRSFFSLFIPSPICLTSIENICSRFPHCPGLSLRIYSTGFLGMTWNYLLSAPLSSGVAMENTLPFQGRNLHLTLFSVLSPSLSLFPLSYLLRIAHPLSVLLLGPSCILAPGEGRACVCSPRPRA